MVTKFTRSMKLMGGFEVTRKTVEEIAAFYDGQAAGHKTGIGFGFMFGVLSTVVTLWLVVTLFRLAGVSL